jgi:protein TonB
MSTLVLYSDEDRAGMARWSVSSAIVVLFHVALIAAILAWYKPPSTAGAALPMIMVDLAPASSAPGNRIVDVPPGPDMQQADAPPPPPPEAAQQQEAVQEQLPPTPPQPSPAVEAPMQPEIAPPPPNPEPANPQPAKTIPDPAKPPPVKPKPVHAQTNKPSEKPPAPRTSAAPKAERRAPSMSAPSAVSGAMAAAALASYNQLVAAHLQRFKQYPSSSKAAGEQGVSKVSFTLSRGGQVLSDRLAGSSGYPALDAETVAMVRRAQPFPPMPPELKQASMGFTVPIRFSVR